MALPLLARATTVQSPVILVQSQLAKGACPYVLATCLAPSFITFELFPLLVIIISHEVPAAEVQTKFTTAPDGIGPALPLLLFRVGLVGATLVDEELFDPPEVEDDDWLSGEVVSLCLGSPAPSEAFWSGAWVVAVLLLCDRARMMKKPPMTRRAAIAEIKIMRRLFLMCI